MLPRQTQTSNPDQLYKLLLYTSSKTSLTTTTCKLHTHMQSHAKYDSGHDCRQNNTDSQHATQQTS
jgi:hypothetical protein